MQFVPKINQCNVTDVNVLEGSVRSIKEYAEALLWLVETRLEVNDETKCVVTFRDQNAG